MPFLELRNVSKSYGINGSRTEVLKNINLSVEEGEFLAIVGYSGAGKTTLISMLAGLVKPDEGQALIQGQLITEPGPDRAIVFQNYSLLPWMTVQQNVALAVDKVFPKESAAARRDRTARALAMVNLTAAAEKKPSELSGGMRQRVSVARALSMNPWVLLLDEPLGALDALTRATIQDEIERIWATDRKTVVLITNDVDEAILLADRIIPLSAGPAAVLGPSVKVDMDRPRNRKAMNHDPRFKAIRQQVIEWLLGEGSPSRRASRKIPVRKTIRPQLKVGFLPLTDCAPLIVAAERGLFSKHGLDITLSKFPSWDSITDALCDGKIEAAHLLSSIPVAIGAGLMGQRKTPLVVPWILNRNGQGITLKRELAGKVATKSADLKAEADLARAGGSALHFASTHTFGTHAMLLRYWLAAGGIDPDQDVNLTVTPPPLMIAGLRQGEIAGFCGGEPWNAKAVLDGVGFTALASQDIWPEHPEKAVAFTEAYAEANSEVVRRFLMAVHEASEWCDDPINRPEIADLLSRPEFLNVRSNELLPRLEGNYDFGDGRSSHYALHPLRFSANHTNYPQQKHAIWFLTQFRRWGMVQGEPDYTAIARRVFRGDLYSAFAESIKLDHSSEDEAAEVFFDGVVFDPTQPEAYANGFIISRTTEVPAAPSYAQELVAAE